MTPNLLLFTNGHESTWPSIEYSTWMATRMQARLTLVGLLETPEAESNVEEIFGRAVSLFQESGLSYTLQLETGLAEDVIPRKAAEQTPTLIIVGPLGRPALKRFLVGRSFRHLMAEISQPILYIPVARIPLQKMLICLGGLEYGLTAEHLGVSVARMVGASVTLLTVVPEVERDYPESQNIRAHWKTLAESDTLPGRTLRKALQAALQSQVTVRVITRQGNAVEEIRAEMKAGGYDLVCMGSPYSAHGLRQMVGPNVTAEVAESAECPILTARFVAQETKTAS
jgi:nucleotide-binding universal stress UspA family protein